MSPKEKSKLTLVKLGNLAKAQGLTQESLAQQIGIRQQTVSQIFTGRFHPTLDNLIKYLDAINELAGTEYSLKDVDFN